METKKVTIESIRDNFSKIKIPPNEISDKNGMPYIKWSYALSKLQKEYPDVKWQFREWEQADGTKVDVQYYKDGSCAVECLISIGDIKQSMWLAVTDFRNKPAGDAFSINTAKMRCLTKCIAVCFGFGSYIYGMDMLHETEVDTKAERIKNINIGKKPF